MANGLVVEELVLEVVVAAADAHLRQHPRALRPGQLAVGLGLLAERREFRAPRGASSTERRPGPAAGRLRRRQGLVEVGRAVQRLAEPPVVGGQRDLGAVGGTQAFCRASASATCTASRSFFGTSSRSNIAPMSPDQRLERPHVAVGNGERTCAPAARPT